MRFLGYRNPDGTEWQLSPETSLADYPQLSCDVDGRPMTQIAVIDTESDELEVAWKEAKLVWEEVMETFRLLDRPAVWEPVNQ